MVKVSKPTGDAECPPQVERAHQIEWYMNEKAGTRDLDDSEIVNAEEDDYDNDDRAISISSDDNDVPRQPLRKKSRSVTVKMEASASLGPIARRSISNRLDTPSAPIRNTRTTRNGPADLLSSISRSLDPSFSAARDEDRATRSLQTTQFLSLSNQLRDAQAATNDLRNRLLQADRDRNDAERRADRAELQLDMERMRTSAPMSIRSPEYSRRRDHREQHRNDHHAHRRITRYRGGGESTTWVTPSDEEEEALRQPWLDEDIISREYTDVTPSRP